MAQIRVKIKKNLLFLTYTKEYYIGGNPLKIMRRG